jgi:hypothetical protein
MRKKRGPALYELINSKQSIGENPLKKDWGRPKREEVDLDHNVLTPGRSIRVSIGTIGVVVAVSIALIVISYTMGFRKGSAIAREDYEQNSYQQISESFTEPAVQDVQKEPVQTPSTQATSTLDPTKTAWSPILSDPRELNNYYFTLMQTTKEGAMQLASFCRQKGLETYVVSGNNTRLYRVVALPGSTDLNAPSLRKVQSHIHAVGRDWAGTNTGRGSDLKDAYLSIKKK